MWIRKCFAVLCCLVLCSCAEQEEAAITTMVNPPLSTTKEMTEPKETAGAKRLESAKASPNGRYEVWISSEVGDGSTQLMFWDHEEKLIRWWDGAYSVTEPSVCWSDDGTYVAINRPARTYTRITILETNSWTEWEFVLPDGSPIPEYVFLPEDWCVWTEENVLRVRVGRGGDAGEQTTYRCTVEVKDGMLTGTTAYAEKILAEDYDFNHNGIAETVTLEGNAGENSTFWVLRVLEEGEELWVDTAALSHAGWNSLFACKINGEDYLLWYDPWTGTMGSDYRYQIFSLDGIEGKNVLEEKDLQFGVPEEQQSEDPVGMATFLEEIHGYLENSALLLTTQSGVFRSGGTGANYRDDLEFILEHPLYTEELTLKENLQRMWF